MGLERRAGAEPSWQTGPAVRRVPPSPLPTSRVTCACVGTGRPWHTAERARSGIAHRNRVPPRSAEASATNAYRVTSRKVLSWAAWPAIATFRGARSSMAISRHSRITAAANARSAFGSDSRQDGTRCTHETACAAVAPASMIRSASMNGSTQATFPSGFGGRMVGQGRKSRHHDCRCRWGAGHPDVN